jgi:Protein of unknown function (DUF1559)
MSFSFVGGQSRPELPVSSSRVGLAEQFQALGEAVARVPRRRRKWRLKLLAMLVFPGALLTVMAVVGPTALREDQKLKCRKNLYAIGRAFGEYWGAREHFPAAAVTDKTGRSLLSWRVTILPYLGERELFNEFHLNEPWDSPHNFALLPRMPKAYACPSEPGRRSFLTNYLVVVGPNEALGGARPLFDRAREVDIREVTDGLSATLMVAETNRSVPWTKPEDLSFADPQLMSRFGSRHPGGFYVVTGEGSIHFIELSDSLELLPKAITRDGGEVVSGES